MNKIVLNFIAFFILVSALVGINWIINRTSDQIKDTKERIIVLKKEKEQTQELVQKYHAARPVIPYINDLLPTNNTLPEAIAYIESLATTDGISISFDFEEKDTKKRQKAAAPKEVGSTPLVFDIVVEGEGGKVKQFLQSLSSARYFIDFKNINWHSPDGHTQHTKLTITVGFYVDPQFKL